MTSAYPDIEGQLYTTTTPNATYTEAEARQRAASHREVAATASAAGASALADAKAYTDTKVTGLATTAAMQAGDQKSLTDAKAYTDAQLAGFSGNGVETVSGTVTLDASGDPIREFFTTGTTTFSANGTTVQVGAFTAVVWRRTGVGSWGYQEVPDEWTTPTPTPDTTAPVAGTLAVTTTDVKADLTVTGATDDRGVTGYAFQVNGGAWSSWQTGPAYTATGLSASTSYQFRHKVRDAAGNETLGTAVSKTTAAEPLVPLVPLADVMADVQPTMWLRFSEPSGSTTLANSGTGSHSATVAIPAEVTLGVPGLTSDGTAARFQRTGVSTTALTGVRLEDSSATPAQVSAWTMGVRVKTAGNGDVLGTQVLGGRLTIDNGKVTFRPGSASTQTGTATVADGQTHTIIAVVDGSTFTVYVDGAQDISYTHTGPFSTSNRQEFPVTAGGYKVATDMTLDELFLKPSAITATQVEAISKAG